MVLKTNFLMCEWVCNILISEASEGITLSKVRLCSSREYERKVSNGGPIRAQSPSPDHVMENVYRKGVHMFSRRLIGTCPDPVSMSDLRFSINGAGLRDGASTSTTKLNFVERSLGHADKMLRTRNE